MLIENRKNNNRSIPHRKSEGCFSFIVSSMIFILIEIG